MSAHEMLVELLKKEREATEREWRDWEDHMRKILVRAVAEEGMED